jgi:hypothetical protein
MQAGCLLQTKVKTDQLWNGRLAEEFALDNVTQPALNSTRMEELVVEN